MRPEWTESPGLTPRPFTPSTSPPRPLPAHPASHQAQPAHLSAWSLPHLQLPPFFIQPSSRHPSTVSSRGSHWPRPRLARTSPGAHLPRFPSRTFQSPDPSGHPTSPAPPSLSTEASIVQRASRGTFAQMSRSGWRRLTAASGLRRSRRPERGGLKAPTGAALTGGSACASMQAGGPVVEQTAAAISAWRKSEDQCPCAAPGMPVHPAPHQPQSNRLSAKFVLHRQLSPSSSNLLPRTFLLSRSSLVSASPSRHHPIRFGFLGAVATRW